MRRDDAWSDSEKEDAADFLSDIYKKEFRRKMIGGYDPREVDAFMEMAGDVLKSLLQEVRELRAREEEYRRRQEEYLQAENTLRNALVSSQKLGENVIATAKREAQTLVEAARVEKERIELEASKLPASLVREIKQLRDLRERLRSDMSAVLSTYRVYLDSLLPAEEVLRGPGLGEATNDRGASLDATEGYMEEES